MPSPHPPPPPPLPSPSPPVPPGAPLTYVNPQFCLATGYSAAEVRGRNCAFLQGEGTSPAAVRRLACAIASAQSCRVELVNYTKGGRAFVNYLTLKPVFEPAPTLGADGAAQWRMAFYLGVQYEATAADPPTRARELEALLQSLPSEVD